MDLSIDGTGPRRVVSAASADDVVASVRAANDAGEAVVAWGGGTRIGVGSTPTRYDVALDLRGMRGVVDHSPADLVCSVRAGTTLAELADALAPSGQRWPVEAPDPEHATVGGTIASAVPSPSRLRFQHPRDWIIGCEAVLGDGTRTRAGGHVVKNVTGYDLTRLYSGSYGTLAILTELSLKLVAIDPTRRTVRMRGDGLADVALRVRRELPCDGIVLTPSALYVRVGGDPDAVERVMRGLAAIASMEEVGDAEVDALIARTLTADVVARCAVPPGSETTVVPEADLAFVGVGVAYLYGARPSEKLARLRAACEAVGGALVLERAPREIRDGLGTWGTSRLPASIARSLKSRFDPRGVLAPGRMPT